MRVATRASIPFAIFMLLVGVSFAFGSVWLLISGDLSDESDFRVFALVAAAPLFLLAGALGAASLTGHGPRVEGDAKGVRHSNYFGLRKRSWAWAEIGPLAPSVQQIGANKQVYLCAFSAGEHAAQRGSAEGATPTHKNAAVVIQLSGTREGRNAKTAAAFAQKLNQLRAGAVGEERLASSSASADAPAVRESRYERSLLVAVLIAIGFLAVGSWATSLFR
ncbi:MAG: hypothetical protein AAFN79_06800 [Pseudomonadota bacterium]